MLKLHMAAHQSSCIVITIHELCTLCSFLKVIGVTLEQTPRELNVL